MLAVFRRELTPRADCAIRVTRCSVEPGKSEKGFWTGRRKGRVLIAYTLAIEVRDEPEREYVLLGVSPVEPGFPRPELRALCTRIRIHPAISPFREPVAEIEDLQLGLYFYPLDPDLPGLAEINGTGGAELLARLLPECRAGAKLERIECELRRYKPFNRVVLRVRATLTGHLARESERAVYVKVFRGDNGARSWRELASLWTLAQRSSFLRVPEPLGYDPDQRLLVMSEVPGQSFLSDWVHCIVAGESPATGERERLERCLVRAANGLHELQASGLRPEERHTFQDELSDLRQERDALRGDGRPRPPELLARAERLLERLERLSPVDEPLVPCHGEYKPQQMIGDERSLTIIDWDGFCLANPAFDAARLLARLRRNGLRCPDGSGELERMADTFRRAFVAQRPEIDAQVALYEGLDLTKHVFHALGSSGRSSRGERGLAGTLASSAERTLDRIDP